MVAPFVEDVRLNNNNFYKLYCPFTGMAIPFYLSKNRHLQAACASSISFVDE